ncbi:MAG TPA: ABC transporter C-terminal domain-containing protein, partial [Bacteroidia bacterium]|nr:ABC transporter C-terminal domain-containing protein [Bacteroidia bacterium]
KPKKEEKVKPAATNNTQPQEDTGKKIKQLQSKINKIESDIADLEKKISEADKTIGQPDFYTKPDSNSVLAQYQSLKTQLEEKFKYWEEVSAELSTIA